MRPEAQPNRRIIGIGLLALALLAGGFRSLVPNGPTRRHARTTLRTINAAEPIDDQDDDGSPEVALAASARYFHRLGDGPPIRHLASAPLDQPPRRVVRRVKRPPAHDDSVPPY